MTDERNASDQHAPAPGGCRWCGLEARNMPSGGSRRWAGTNGNRRRPSSARSACSHDGASARHQRDQVDAARHYPAASFLSTPKISRNCAGT